MKLGIILFISGIVLFCTGIFFSTLLSTGWIVVGSLMALIGGGLLGISTHFFVSSRKTGHR
ncbi:hypothetical protein [Sporosarcina aquimarina]|uniref:Uncharacterized protein n=1 Tax=Sporosarcina aquimarina TaxID=114975 RepID=A0ABU4G000_9BACL|nr:hypothetical protein [Sporosarcina aquimarina]MDW0109690.1 hypothetical protein [Sporosarcina aquimarina]